MDSEIEPFVGLIVRPPSKKVAAVRDHTWFHVQQVSKNDNKYHRLISMGYNGIRLNENDENGVFCMRMHVSIRTRKDSFADFIFQVSRAVIFVNLNVCSLIVLELTEYYRDNRSHY